MGTGCIKIMGSGYVLLLSPLPSTVRCRARGLHWKRCRLGSVPWVSRPSGAGRSLGPGSAGGAGGSSSGDLDAKVNVCPD